MLTELNSLKYGAVEQFASHSYTSYIEVVVPGQGDLWLMLEKFEDYYVWACEAKGEWWVDQNVVGRGLIISRVAVMFTDREKALLKTFFNNVVDGVISMNANGTLQISHQKVLFVHQHRGRGLLYCNTGTNCGVYCEATGVLGKMRIQIIASATNMHFQHNTTPLPTLGYTVVSLLEFNKEFA